MRSLAAKRLLDVVGSSAGLLVAAPAFVLVGALVRLKLGSPVLFRQERPGLKERPFVILKFRTMRDAVDASGNPLSDADRLTPLGRFLRSTSLDELPELLNVLRGDMSLVGPRPLLTEYLPRYDAVQRRRHDVKPGITGWAAVNGRNALDWDRKFALDTWYVDNWSNELDLRILFATVLAVIRREGISHDSHATMPKFDGNKANVDEGRTTR
jgi:lipopolysaccharide/colanic/teichoic acid biosynthesis glycosyltransferase